MVGKKGRGNVRVPPWITILIDRLKTIVELGGKPLFMLSITGWVLYFLPDRFLRWLDPALIVAHQQARPYLAGVALFGTVLWLASGLFAGATYALKKVSKWLRVRQGLRLLEDLTPVEKAYLRRYVDSGTRTQSFTITDGVVTGLCGKGILYPASRYGHGVIWQDHNIQPWAWKAIQANPRLLEGAADAAAIARAY